MGTEFELKYAATEDVQAKLYHRFGPFRSIDMETTYYDTAEGALASRKITLRLRKENDETICTLKVPLPRGGLGEWETTASSLQEGLSRLLVAGAPAAVAVWDAASLIPVCGARFTRMAAMLPTCDGSAELALDVGVLLGGGKEMPLCEVEVERKTGSDEATRALAEAIAAEFGLQPESRSKFRRASILTQGE